jgi:AraC-like DNA-binding protein
LKSSRNTIEVTTDQLKHAALLAGTQRRLDHSHKGNTLLRGHFCSSRSPSGIGLHSIDAEEAIDAQHEIWLDPGISLSVLLQGSVRFDVGGQQHIIEATEQCPQAFAMLVPNRTAWTRQLKRGNKLKKFNIFLSQQWLHERQHSSPHYLSLQHSLKNSKQEVFQWLAPIQSIRCAEKLIQQHKQKTNDDFLCDAFSLELLASMFSNLNQQTAIEQDQLYNRLADNIRNYLEENIVHNPDCLRPHLQQMARRLGASVSSMQRNFKKASGQTIFEYVRCRKLSLAKNALLNKGTSIIDAATMAGYSHTNNFSKAFKCEFGLSPRECLNLQ